MAAEIADLEIDVSDDDSISISHHIAVSTRLLIWLPSEKGISDGSISVANDIADLGINVWMTDLHASLMLPPGSRSLELIPLDYLVRLIDLAQTGGFRQIYFVAAGRGVQLALNTIYQYSTLNPESGLLKGSIFFHPNIFIPVSLPGEVAEFVEGSDSSHLPLYLIQAQFSTKYAYTQQIRDQLELGGSRVFTHIIPEVGADFAFSPEQGLSEASLDARRRLPGIMLNAIRLLSTQPPGILKAVRKEIKPGGRSSPVSSTGLRVMRDNIPAPGLDLQGLDGKPGDLQDYQGRVILVNFWASWCKPCVEEIPSLHRLRDRIEDPGFEVVTVNVGEERDRIAHFLERVPVELPLLLDLDSKVAKDWKIYVYPSSYLVDHDGQIRYAYLGALEWDSPEIIAIIQSLLKNR